MKHNVDIINPNNTYPNNPNNNLYWDIQLIYLKLKLSIFATFYFQSNHILRDVICDICHASAFIFIKMLLLLRKIVAPTLNE